MRLWSGFCDLNTLPATSKRALALIAAIRACLGCPHFLARHRHGAQAFTRERELTFARVTLLILQQGVKSIQSRLSEFYDRLYLLALQEHHAQAAARARSGAGVTKSAWTQARAKLAHTAFIALNTEALLPCVYAPGAEALVARWRGHRLCAIDGSLLRLPGRAAPGAHFGWQQGANGRGACGERLVQGRASVYFDVLNRLGLDARLEPFAVGERAVAARHLGAVLAGDVILLDRGYCGAAWLARVRAAGADFVCRVPRNWLPAARALFAANQAGQSRRLPLPGGGAEPLRLVSVRLPTGELEVLATSLLDEALYPVDDLAGLYHLRWGIETFYGVLKGRLEVERFSGETLEAVQQDFFASVFLSNVESILSAPAQSQLSAGDARRRHPLQVNRARSFHALKSHALDLFGSGLPPAELLPQLTALMRLDPVAKRPGRKVARTPGPLRRVLAYLRYQRKHVF